VTSVSTESTLSSPSPTAAAAAAAVEVSAVSVDETGPAADLECTDGDEAADDVNDDDKDKESCHQDDEGDVRPAAAAPAGDETETETPADSDVNPVIDTVTDEVVAMETADVVAIETAGDDDVINESSTTAQSRQELKYQYSEGQSPSNLTLMLTSDLSIQIHVACKISQGDIPYTNFEHFIRFYVCQLC